MALGEASSKGDLATVERLLGRRAESWTEAQQGLKPDDERHFYNPYEFGGERVAPLWCAAFRGHTEVVAVLLDAGADPEWADSNGWTALHASATLGHADTARSLVEGGAQVDARDIHGTTPLMYVAAEAGDLGCAKALLELGATPALRATGGRFFGKSAEQIAVEMGKAGVAALLSDTVYLQPDGEVRASDELSLGPTQSTAEPPAVTEDNPNMGESAFRGDVDQVAAWLRYGITPEDVGHFRVDRRGYWGLCSPLWWAAAKGHTEIVAMLQAAGADSEWANDTGWTPLHISARLGHDLTAAQLVEGGAEVDAATRSGSTALMWAAAFDKPRCIEVLLELGADAAIEDKAGRTALRIAAFRGHEQSCQRLVEGRAKVDATNKHGMTALMFAAYWDHPACVEVLLRLGADPSLRATSGGCEGATASQIADRRGKPHITQLLEDVGVN